MMSERLLWWNSGVPLCSRPKVPSTLGSCINTGRCSTCCKSTYSTYNYSKASSNNNNMMAASMGPLPVSDIQVQAIHSGQCLKCLQLSPLYVLRFWSMLGFHSVASCAENNKVLVLRHTSDISLLSDVSHMCNYRIHTCPVLSQRTAVFCS